jgi:hypothetical protein
MRVLPLEMANHIWNFCDINTKLVMNRAFGTRTFYTTRRTNIKASSVLKRQLDRLLRISYFRYVVLKQIHIINSQRI